MGIDIGIAFHQVFQEFSAHLSLVMRLVQKLDGARLRVQITCDQNPVSLVVVSDRMRLQKNESNVLSIDRLLDTKY